MKPRSYRQGDVQWRGHTLVLSTGRPLVTIERDSEYPTVYRARLRSGFVSDILNLSRVRAVAVGLALAELNQALDVS